MTYRVRYTRKDGNGAFLQSATGRIRTFQTKKGAKKVAETYDYKKNIRVIKK